MAPERRNQVILLTALGIGVVGALAAGIYFGWPRPSATATPASNEPGAGGPRSARAAPGGPQAPDVHLPALQAERPKPMVGERNLFRFRPKPLPPPPPPTFVAPPPSTGPTAATVPPITLRFLGAVEVPGRRKIAALVDDHGNSIQCFDGQVDCDGRYRIWRIGAESIDISYLDGTGRRTIPVNRGG